MDPIDKSRCSFPVPDFTDEAEEIAWAATLTPQQRLELLELTRLARYGEEALARGIDRSRVEVLSMDEFVARRAVRRRTGGALAINSRMAGAHSGTAQADR